MAAVKVRIDSFAGWEELIMNETAAAPPNTEHELLLEAGRFWSRYFFTSRHPHLPSPPVHWEYPFLIGGPPGPPVIHL